MIKGTFYLAFPLDLVFAHRRVHPSHWSRASSKTRSSSRWCHLLSVSHWLKHTPRNSNTSSVLTKSWPRTACVTSVNEEKPGGWWTIVFNSRSLGRFSPPFPVRLLCRVPVSMSMPVVERKYDSITAMLVVSTDRSLFIVCQYRLLHLFAGHHSANRHSIRGITQGNWQKSRLYPIMVVSSRPA